MKALSIRQPWASLIALGEKMYETRSWSTTYRGPLAIHASKTWGKDQERLLGEWPFRSALIGPDGDFFLPLGAVIAVCRLVDVQRITPSTPHRLGSWEKAFGDWRTGRFAWRLSEVQRIDPVPARGMLGLWTWEHQQHVG